MKFQPKQIYPLLVVLSAISLIEVAMTVLYPRLTSAWERVPVLFVILLVPISIVSAFIYLWLKKPGHLYPPSEFGKGEWANKMAYMFSCRSEDETKDFASLLSGKQSTPLKSQPEKKPKQEEPVIDAEIFDTKGPKQDA